MFMFTFSIFSEHVVTRVRRLEVQAGGVLFIEGAPTEAVYHVESGVIKLVVHPEPSKQLVAFRAVEGELFGDEHLFTDRYRYTAVADTNSVVWTLDRDLIKADITQNPAVALAFIECQANRYAQLRSSFRRLGIGSAKDRILEFLTEKSDSTGVVRLDGTLKSFSDDLNLTHETVYRMLAELERSGTIQKNGQQIRICQPVASRHS